MGGSRRRLKKHAPKVRVGLIKRSKKLKAPVPELIVSQCPALKDKLGTEARWATAQTAVTNYAQNGVVNEPNTLATATAQRQGGGEEQQEEDNDSSHQQKGIDLDLQLALSQQHPEGARPPAPLTANQRRVIQGLIDAHGTNVDAMVKDSKRNKMLHSAGKLKRMLQAFHLHKEGARVKWQQPKNKLW